MTKTEFDKVTKDLKEVYYTFIGNERDKNIEDISDMEEYDKIITRLLKHQEENKIFSLYQDYDDLRLWFIHNEKNYNLSRLERYIDNYVFDQKDKYFIIHYFGKVRQEIKRLNSELLHHSKDLFSDFYNWYDDFIKGVTNG